MPEIKNPGNYEDPDTYLKVYRKLMAQHGSAKGMNLFREWMAKRDVEMMPLVTKTHPKLANDFKMKQVYANERELDAREREDSIGFGWQHYDDEMKAKKKRKFGENPYR